MMNYNYNEPEFKVVKMASQDVLTASFESVDNNWDTMKNGDAVDAGSLFG